MKLPIAPLVFAASFFVLTTASVFAFETPYATGKAIGSLHLIEVPRAVARALVPSELELAPQAGPVRADKYPIILFFGRQQHVHWVVNGFNLPDTIGPEYFEYVMLVPDLSSPKHPGRRFAHAPRMFLDGVRATLAGELYNFNKVLADFGSSADDRYDIRQLVSGTPLVSMSYEPAPGLDDAKTHAHLDQVRAWFDQPLYQPRLDGVLGDLCSVFDWKLDQAQIAPVRSRTSFDSSFLRGLPINEWKNASLAEQPVGAFSIVTQWTLTLPKDCGRI